MVVCPSNLIYGLLKVLAAIRRAAGEKGGALLGYGRFPYVVHDVHLRCQGRVDVLVAEDVGADSDRDIVEVIGIDVPDLRLLIPLAEIFLVHIGHSSSHSVATSIRVF